MWHNVTQMFFNNKRHVHLTGVDNPLFLRRFSTADFVIFLKRNFKEYSTVKIDQLIYLLQLYTNVFSIWKIACRFYRSRKSFICKASTYICWLSFTNIISSGTCSVNLKWHVSLSGEENPTLLDLIIYLFFNALMFDMNAPLHQFTACT